MKTGRFDVTIFEWPFWRGRFCVVVSEMNAFLRYEKKKKNQYKYTTVVI